MSAGWSSRTGGKERALAEVVRAQVGRGHGRSCVAAVQSEDRSLDFVGAAGLADPSRGTPMESGTPFFAASITKMFTAAITMRLVTEARLALDAPITEHLPPALTERIHLWGGRDYSSRIRVRDLVAQTSGLPDHEGERPSGGRSVMDELLAGHDRAVTAEQAVAIVRTLRAHFPPGASGRAYYSNTNYLLLGQILQRVTQLSMAECIERFVGAELGLEQTYLYDWSRRRDPAPAMVYVGERPAQIAKYITSDLSAGGLVSTASELVVFLRAFFEGRLFPRARLSEMMVWNRLFFPLRYGYGLMCFRLPRFVWPTRIPELVGHSGSTGSFAFACPSRGLYLAGTLNQVSPARPFFVMQSLLGAAR